MQWVTVDRARYPDAPEHVGIIHWHRTAEGTICGGAVSWWVFPEERGSRPTWKLVSEDPLTLEPSILCSPAKGGCGIHGFIRNSAWVPA